MNNVKVVADSSVCLSKELLEKYHIELVPEHIIFGNKVYRDGIDLIPQEFYTLLEQAKDLPSTSAPPPQDFINAYRKVATEASSIVYILVSAGFSQMGWQSALVAKEACPQIPIEIVDSRTAVGAYGFVVPAAARDAAEGKTL